MKIHLFFLTSGSGLSWSLLLFCCSAILLLLLRVVKKLGFHISVVLDEGRLTLRNSLMKLWAVCLFEVVLPRLSGSLLADVVRRTKVTAGGLDGWRWREFKVLPVSWFDGLARILSCVFPRLMVMLLLWCSVLLVFFRWFPGLLLSAARFTTGYVRLVGQEPAPSKCVLVSTSGEVRKDMKEWVLSQEGDQWSVKFDVWDLGGHLDTTFRGWFSTLAARVRLVLSRLVLIFALPLDFHGRIRVVRSMYLPAALHGVEASLLDSESLRKLRSSIRKVVWSRRQPLVSVGAVLSLLDGPTGCDPCFLRGLVSVSPASSLSCSLACRGWSGVSSACNGW